MALSLELFILIIRAIFALSWTNKTVSLGGYKNILRSTLPLTGGSSANTIQLQSYRIIYPVLGYVETSATLSVTSNIGSSIMAIISQIYSQLLTPRLYQTDGLYIKQFISIGILLTAALLILLFPFHEVITTLLSNKEYAPYSFAIFFGIIIEACNMLISAFSVYFMLKNKSSIIFFSQFLAALFSTIGILALLFINPQSSVLLGATIAATQIIAVIFLHSYYRLLISKQQ
jgi:O-antigen/teichoic acid export membrane protein